MIVSDLVLKSYLYKAGSEYRATQCLLEEESKTQP